MTRFQNVSFALVLLVASVCAVRPRNFGRTRYLARQEVAADVPAVTPYPSADELKPAVPFDETAENTPSVVYGPPEDTLTNVPDEVYGPPEADVNSEPAEEPTPEVFATAEEAQKAARLTAARRARFQRQRLAALRRTARLTSPRL